MKKIIACLIILLVCSGCGSNQMIVNNGSSEASVNSFAEKESVSEAQSETDTPSFSDLEFQIYQFWNEFYDMSTTGSMIHREEVTYVEASKEFDMPILEIERIRYKISKVDHNLDIDLDDASIDFLMMKRINEDYSFIQKDGIWYYNNEGINVGEPLPTPEHLLKKEAENGKEIDVFIGLTVEISELKGLTIIGETNLPDNMKLQCEVVDSTGRYLYSDFDVFVNDGTFKTLEIFDATRPAKRIADGEYKVYIRSAAASVLGKEIMDIIGDNGQNLTGDLVEYDSIFGNMINYSEVIVVK